jgi:xanthine dehydrogenase accessory factor
MSNDHNQQLLKELLQAQEQGEPVVLATVIRARGSVPRHSGAKMLIYDDGRISGTIGGGEMEARVVAEALACMAAGETRIVPYSLVDPKRGDPGVCGGEVEIYLEPYGPPATLLVIGCGHVGKAVAELGHWLGYRVVVNDDRRELASPEHILDADVYMPGSVSDMLSQMRVHGNTFITVLTRNVLLDREILPLLAETEAPYIGVIGSQRRWRETKELLLADGMTQEALERFHSPIGLELHAESPEEIAVSILSEILLMRHEGSGQRMAKKSAQGAPDERPSQTTESKKQVKDE